MTTTILLITGESAWTQRAAHLAGALARELGARDQEMGVLLLRLVRVDHLEYLGAALREPQLSYAEFAALSEYAATVESYGVRAEVQLFEYSDYAGAVLSAAEQCAAAAVFAPAPAGPIAVLARLRLWLLRRALRRPLYVVGAGDGHWLLESGPRPADDGQTQLTADHRPLTADR
jgi:hypothetical protein